MKGWQDLLAFWQIEASRPARLIAVAVPEGSAETLTLSEVQSPRTASTDISASHREGYARSFAAVPTAGEAALKGHWLAIRWKVT